MFPERRFGIAAAFSVLALIVFVIVQCGGGREPFDIDAEQAITMIAGDNPPAVIDVRTPEEYIGELGHIPGARLIPIDVFKDSIGALSYLKDSTIVVVCKVGYRSRKAALQLLDNDFKNVYNLHGGMEAWNEAGGETEK